MSNLAVNLVGGKCIIISQCRTELSEDFDGNGAYMQAQYLKKGFYGGSMVICVHPAGAIVVWGKGTSTSGHISIAQGNGMETSDFVGNQMTYHYGGAPARVFLPKGRM